MNQKQMSDFAKELGRKGGIAKFKKYGKDAYVKMARVRWNKNKAKLPT